MSDLEILILLPFIGTAIYVGWILLLWWSSNKWPGRY